VFFPAFCNANRQTFSCAGFLHCESPIDPFLPQSLI
jgi:hypothetical protein